MFQNFSGQTANDAWRAVAKALRAENAGANGRASAQPSRAGDTRELLHATVSIADPRQRWVTAREPAINPAFAIAEVIWILEGRNDSRFPTYFNRQLPRFAGGGPTFHGAYGFRLRRHRGLDQLERAYRALRANPDSRQVVLQIWDSTIDLPAMNGDAVAPDIPCNVISMLKVRNERLEWTQVLRSNDVFRGLPYNIIQFTSLQEVLAGWLGLQVGSYNHLSDSMHVYMECLPDLDTTTESTDTTNEDDLRLPKDASDRVVMELAAGAERVADESVPAAALAAAAERSSLPVAYRNMLMVLTAEGVRRRGQPTLATEVMRGCSNPVFGELMRRWSSRLSERQTTRSGSESLG
jgi:thymidylate synthase